jgi:hypothetical protein
LSNSINDGLPTFGLSRNKLLQLDGDSVDLAGESIWRLVFEADRRAKIAADVECFAGCVDAGERDSPADAPLIDNFTDPETGPRAGEARWAGRSRFRKRLRIGRHSQLNMLQSGTKSAACNELIRVIVGNVHLVVNAAVFDVEAEAAQFAAFSKNHALRAVWRNNHIGIDGVRVAV